MSYFRCIEEWIFKLIPLGNIYMRIKFCYFILVLMLGGCAHKSSNTEPEKLTYSDISHAVISVVIQYPENKKLPVHEYPDVSFLQGINTLWPDMNLVVNHPEASPQYILQTTVIDYSVSYKNFERTEISEAAPYEEVGYIIYETKTKLITANQLIEIGTGRKIWSNNIHSKDISELKEIDSCFDKNELKSFLCDIFGPIVISPLDLLLVGFSPEDQQKKMKFPEPAPIDKMFYLAGEDMAADLPKPECSVDGLGTCLRFRVWRPIYNFLFHPLN